MISPTVVGSASIQWRLERPGWRTRDVAADAMDEAAQAPVADRTTFGKKLFDLLEHQGVALDRGRVVSFLEPDPAPDVGGLLRVRAGRPDATVARRSARRGADTPPDGEAGRGDSRQSA